MSIFRVIISVHNPLNTAFSRIPANATSLDLSTNNLEQYSHAELREAFSTLPAHIKSINLSNNGLLGIDIRDLLTIFHSLPETLEVIDFSEDQQLLTLNREQLTTFLDVFPKNVRWVKINPESCVDQSFDGSLKNPSSRSTALNHHFFNQQIHSQINTKLINLPKRIAPQVVLFDVRWDNDRAGICEMGDGLRSSFAGFQTLHNKDMGLIVYEELTDKFDKVITLSSSDRCTQMDRITQRLKNAQKISHLSICKDIPYPNGRYPYQYGEQNYSETNEEKVQTILEHIKKITKNKADLTCCFIVDFVVETEDKIKDYHLAQYLQQQLLLHYPQGNMVVVNSDPMTAALTENKLTFMSLQSSDIASKTLNLLNISPKKTQNIQELDKHIVLKPLNNAGGCGVNIIPAKSFKSQTQFLGELVKIKAKNNATAARLTEAKSVCDHYEINSDLSKDRKYSAWLFGHKSLQQYAICQPYFPSKTFNNRSATLRINCIVYPDNTIKFIGGFWNLAGIETGSSLSTDAIVCASDDSQRDVLAPLSASDSQKIEASLREQLLEIYSNNGNKSLVDHFITLKTNPDPDVSDAIDEIAHSILSEEDRKDYAARISQIPQGLLPKTTYEQDFIPGAQSLSTEEEQLDENIRCSIM